MTLCDRKCQIHDSTICLERNIAAGRPRRHWTRRGRFQTISQNVFIFIVLVHSAY